MVYGYEGYFCLETHAIRKKEIISRKSLQNMQEILKQI
jgi:hypothetical protein